MGGSAQTLTPDLKRTAIIGYPEGPLGNVFRFLLNICFLLKCECISPLLHFIGVQYNDHWPRTRGSHECFVGSVNCSGQRWGVRCVYKPWMMELTRFKLLTITAIVLLPYSLSCDTSSLWDTVGVLVKKQVYIHTHSWSSSCYPWKLVSWPSHARKGLEMVLTRI